jgi:hypothetical protein
VLSCVASARPTLHIVIVYTVHKVMRGVESEPEGAQRVMAQFPFLCILVRAYRQLTLGGLLLHCRSVFSAPQAALSWPAHRCSESVAPSNGSNVHACVTCSTCPCKMYASRHTQHRLLSTDAVPPQQPCSRCELRPCGEREQALEAVRRAALSNAL